MAEFTDDDKDAIKGTHDAVVRLEPTIRGLGKMVEKNTGDIRDLQLDNRENKTVLKRHESDIGNCFKAVRRVGDKAEAEVEEAGDTTEKRIWQAVGVIATLFAAYMGFR